MTSLVPVTVQSIHWTVFWTDNSLCVLVAASNEYMLPAYLLRNSDDATQSEEKRLRVTGDSGEQSAAALFLEQAWMW